MIYMIFFLVGLIIGIVMMWYLAGIKNNVLKKKLNETVIHINALKSFKKSKIKKNGILSFFEDHNFTHLAIYGFGFNGRMLFNELKDSSIKIDYCIDQNKANIKIDVPLYDLSDDLPETAVIIITPEMYLDEIEENLKKKTNIPIYTIEDVISWD